MRDLDASNPRIAKPSRLASVGAVVPLIISAASLSFADGAAPTVPIQENPISLIVGTIAAVAAILLLLPRVLSWGWQSEYFGVPLLYVGSLALFCLVPCLCIVLYAKFHIMVRLAVFFACLALHVAWCRRFTALYKKIFNSDELRACLYQEESDAVYYLQRGDKYLLEKKYKFRQFPSGWQFVGCLLLSFLLVPFGGTASSVIGVPFANLFLLIGGFPVSLMCVGLAVRGWLVFFFYPCKIRRTTGKRVYVDMTAKPDLSLQGNRKTA